MIARRRVCLEVSLLIHTRESAILQATVPTERLTSLNYDLRPLFTAERTVHRLNEQVGCSRRPLQSLQLELTVGLLWLAKVALLDPNHSQD